MRKESSTSPAKLSVEGAPPKKYEDDGGKDREDNYLVDLRLLKLLPLFLRNLVTAGSGHGAVAVARV